MGGWLHFNYVSIMLQKQIKQSNTVDSTYMKHLYYSKFYGNGKQVATGDTEEKELRIVL